MAISIFRNVQFVSAAVVCLQLVIAWQFQFNPSNAVQQDPDAVAGNHLIDRERGLVLIDGPVRLETDGLYSESGLVAAWYQIVDGKVGSDLQERFQSRLKSFGQPLFLLRTRLARGDWAGANIAATQIEPHIDEGDLVTESLVRFGRFRLGVAAGNPEFSVIPLLDLCRELNEQPDLKDLLLTSLLQDVDIKNAVSVLLVPVWNNQTRAATAWTSLQKLSPLEIGGPSVGWYVYGSSLAIAAGDLEGAERLLQTWNAVLPDDMNWKTVLLNSLAVAKEQPVVAETELTRLLETKRNELSPLQVATANWWIGVCRYRQNLPLSVQTSFREMIAIAATNENDWPVVAESALLIARAIADDQGWDHESFMIGRELELLRSRRLRYNLPVGR